MSVAPPAAPAPSAAAAPSAGAAPPPVSRPEPTSTRWQPLRAGLVDVFLYDQEEFHFRDGNLLLRGNNGTGKSKVLAMLLPFLLDGEVSAHRVEPDGDPNKRMEWNLLMGGRHPHPERLGYSWLEFGRVDAAGTASYRSIGAGLKAVAGRGGVTTWFFVADGRVGIDFGLVGPTGAALTRDRLADVLGTRGRVFEQASRYRRAVDEALFGLGEERYDALVNLLIQLRQPQLSKKPNERALSDALTEALAPLDQAVIADAAEAFRGLEQERADLAGFEEAHEAATAFLTHYRRYARLSARRRAREPRVAQSAYESASRQLAEVKAERERVETEAAKVSAQEAELGHRITALTAERNTLATRPEMDQARELALLGERATDLAAAVNRAGAELAAATTRRDGFARRAASDRTRANGTASALERARDDAEAAARAAGALGEHQRAVEPLLLPEGPPAGEVQAASRGARRAAEEVAGQREEAVRLVARLITGALQAQEKAADRQREQDSALFALDEAAEATVKAGAAYQATSTAWVTAVRQHLDAAEQLRLPEPEGVLARLEDWLDDFDGPSPLLAAVTACARGRENEYGAADQRLRTEISHARDRAAALTSERRGLAEGARLSPPVPYTRAASRDSRPGAPLWQLIEPREPGDQPSSANGQSGDHRNLARPALDSTEIAGVEAALEAAGLLDAWLCPDGRLLSSDTHDTVILGGAGITGITGQDSRPSPRDTAHLGMVLRPAVDRSDPAAAAVSDATVAWVLASIGLLPAADRSRDIAAPQDEPSQDTWVAVDGRFRVGRLAGAWSKTAAHYLGHAAREQHRRTRLAEIDEELAGLDRGIAAGEAGREELRRSRSILNEEVTGLPPDTATRQAFAAARQAERDQQRAATVHLGATTAARTAQAAAHRASAERDETAAQLALPVTATDLDEVRTAVVTYRVALSGLWPAVRERVEAHAQFQQTEQDLHEAQDAVAEREEERDRVRGGHLAAQTAFETLARTVGAAVAEVQRQLAAAERELDQAARSQRALGDRRIEVAEAVGRARGRELELADKVAESGERRREAAGRLRRFAAGGLLAVAVPELEFPDPARDWAPDPAVRLARQIEAAVGDVDDSDPAWDRVQKLITAEHSTLREVMSRHGHHAAATLTDDGWVVEATFRSRSMSPAELADALAAEVADRKRLLTERERTILENHLVSEVASHLQDLISDAERQVSRMNAELDERPNSTGMKLRFQWKPGPDAPTGLGPARERLLRQVADAWSPDDREAVGEFLQAQIERERERDAGGTWLEHLGRALDYRRWHVFSVQRYAGGQWRSASGPASGGERALAVTIPLFAAASGHYRSAGNPHAPRLVMLDEAFAGVDDDARASCLGLLAVFDMDVLMTSEREWGCYPTVPGLAISQLSRRDGIDAVLVTRWQWDGRQRRPASTADSRATTPAGTPMTATTPAPAPTAQAAEVAEQAGVAERPGEAAGERDGRPPSAGERNPAVALSMDELWSSP
ncbi:TIGR02680 family protein [Frankia sp. AiPs1]|uniref:TIGR02680 family protein n=1 Tax=Frankia sp. AiPa1 TaxID=573492 RepID=UPI00202B9727|nr:TIGR02680 family protein [Frankia sp. AiPa1]MCL9758608.1 TIGR02680 family protein [Frankia sp. AiPa1]